MTTQTSCSSELSELDELARQAHDFIEQARSAILAGARHRRWELKLAVHSQNVSFDTNVGSTAQVRLGGS